MLNIVIFGPPGAGKGTQSAKLIEKYQLVHLSTGDILRSEIASNSILGQEAKLLMDQGILVPDSIVITMINNKLQQNALSRGFIFDGFPRTTIQAEALDRLLHSKGKSITMTLALEISNEELIKRIVLRGEELGRTDDQEISIIRNRLAEYEKKTAPLKDYYKKQHKLYSVNGVGNIDEIFGMLSNTIDSHYHSEQTHSPVVLQPITNFETHTHKAEAKPVVQEIKNKGKEGTDGVEPIIKKEIQRPSKTKDVSPKKNAVKMKTDPKRKVVKAVTEKTKKNGKNDLKKKAVKKLSTKKKGVKSTIKKKTVSKKKSIR